jgi:hypothetical protein
VPRARRRENYFFEDGYKNKLGKEGLLSYKFRLRIATKLPRVFAFTTASESFALQDGLELTLVARNASTLDAATTFHFDGGGYSTGADARAAGEALRTKLRVLNAILGLGLNIPVGDTPSGSVSEQVKEKAAEHGGIVVDSVWGLIVFPDDGAHFECVLGGTLETRPSEPKYIFNALKTIWSLNVQLDTTSEVALQILGIANLEMSEKAAFLTSYLALEQLVKSQPRSRALKQLVDRFLTQLTKATKRKRAPIPDNEARSLRSAVANLKNESFSIAFARFGRSLKQPTHIQGIPVREFVSACIGARNQIAHDAEPKPKHPLPILTKGVREIAMGLIWTRNNLPPLTFSTPATAVSAPGDAVAFRVL